MSVAEGEPRWEEAKELGECRVGGAEWKFGEGNEAGESEEHQTSREVGGGRWKRGGRKESEERKEGFSTSFHTWGENHKVSSKSLRGPISNTACYLERPPPLTPLHQLDVVDPGLGEDVYTRSICCPAQRIDDRLQGSLVGYDKDSGMMKEEQDRGAGEGEGGERGIRVRGNGAGGEFNLRAVCDGKHSTIFFDLQLHPLETSLRYDPRETQNFVSLAPTSLFFASHSPPFLSFP
eukprot:751580-Hanusia_phi.AAC.2